jgi:4-amino-4-deoxy-L-arabinose transferase-like glycosyltransferase
MHNNCAEIDKKSAYNPITHMTGPKKMLLKKIHPQPIFYLALILALYSWLLLPTVARQGISWDEQNDIWIARAYLEPDGWLAGSDIDPSQTRLPMFTVAIGYWLFNNTGLLLGRYFSCIVGGLTLVAVYIYAKRRYDVQRGLLASALLATSPFYLSFARVAFTETDIYLACTLAWLVICVDRFQERPSINRAILVGVMAGLAISAKFTALVVLLPIWYAIWQTKGKKQEQNLPSVSSTRFMRWLFVLVLILLGGLYFANTLPPSVYQGALRRYHYFLVSTGWLFVMIWAIGRYRQTTSWFLMGLFVSGLAVLTFLVYPPEHLTNPAILQSMAKRSQQEMAFRPGFMLEATALHVFSILFKSSWVIGVGLLLSLVLTPFQWQDPKKRFPVLVVWVYMATLAVLPLAQTFYTVPLLPLLVLFAADQFFRLAARQRTLAIGLAAAAVLVLGGDLVMCYPDYNLNGYQWLGLRTLVGRPSVGYRSVVQTPSDGVEQAINWLNTNAQPGERVRAYLFPWHIVQAAAPDPHYTLENGFQDRITPAPDYILFSINAQINQDWWAWFVQENTHPLPYNSTWLDTNYQKVFSVQRAFGIEMTSIFQRKPE